MHSNVGLWLLAVLVACRGASADAPSPDPKPKQLPRDEVARLHMHENFDLLRAIERLLIRGKLEDAQRFAAAIAVSPDEPAHGPWAAYTATVRDRAAAVARATTIEDALRKETQLAAACGDCHRENHGTPMFQKPPALPPDRPTLEARMTRHRWAADRLWESVVGSADDAWRDGLDVLAATPLEIDAGRASIARKLQVAATTALKTKHPIANRAGVYGEILVLCASCHMKTP